MNTLNTLSTQHLLERLGSLLRSEMRNQLLPYGLQPVQFDALHYLSRCNRYSDTPMAVTEFLGQTKGSVSQTLKVLEKNGLLEKRADQRDKRVTHLALTKHGRHLAKQLQPSPMLQSAGKLLGEQQLEAAKESLRLLLQTLQRANQFKSFGQCDTCQHNIKQADGKYFCGLTREPLTRREVKLICREHEPLALEG